jgi:hypothetical protein
VFGVAAVGTPLVIAALFIGDEEDDIVAIGTITAGLPERFR